MHLFLRVDLIAYQDVTVFLVLEKVSRKIIPWGEVSVRLQPSVKGMSWRVACLVPKEGG